MAPQATADPYESIATPIQASAAPSAPADPYADIATPIPPAASILDAPKPQVPIQPPQDHREELVHGLSGDVGLGLYRQARTTVSKVEDLLKPEGGYANAKQAVRDFASDVLANAKASVTPEPYDLNAATHPLHAQPITPIPGVAGAIEGAMADPGVAAAGAAAKVNPFRAVVNKFTGSDIQPNLQAGIKDVWGSVAKDAGVAAPTAASVQDAGEEVADSILARSKANYRMIDEATGNRFSGTEKALGDVNRALRSVTNDAEENSLLVRKTRLEMQMNQMMDDAEKQGVSKAHIDAAKADFKKAQAIYDVNHQVRMSTSGVRPGMQGAEAVPEEVNPKALMKRLNNLHNSGRLQQAVGDDAAEDLIGHSAVAQKALRDVARRKLAAEVVGGAVGVPAIAAGAARIAAH